MDSLQNMDNDLKRNCFRLEGNREITGRLHKFRRVSKKISFMVLRKGFYTLQCVLLRSVVGDEKYEEIEKISKESIIRIHGKLSKVKTPVKSCYFTDFECMLSDVTVISPSDPESMPFTIDNASCSCEKEDDGKTSVSMNTRLTYRPYELRTPFNNIIFKAKHQFLTGVRMYLNSLNFTEIHTPKLLGSCTESGAEVFKVDYFNKPAYLAQSPQLYKQMLINADFENVFEVGPVFRAEPSFTKRHQCEFTGLDLEMEIPNGEDYMYVVDILWKTLHVGYNCISSDLLKELTKYHDYIELQIPPKPVIVAFSEAVKLLEETGFTQDPEKDLSTENERELGALIKMKYESDLVIVTEYPSGARPFYTMREGKNGESTRSYDFILRGNEILSGAQREHRYDVLREQIEESGIKPEELQDYLNSFKTGSPPHGGGGFGLERIIMLCLGLSDIRYASLFPRDPARLAP